MLWVWDFKYGEPSLLLGVSGVDLLPGTISRLKLDTLSRKDNAGLGGATGRCGRVLKSRNHINLLKFKARKSKLVSYIIFSRK